jgi:hypothetical protein
MKKSWIAFVMGAPLAAMAGAAHAEPWAPDQQTIAKLEASLKIPDWGRSTQYPDGHVPLVSEYARYYTGEAFDGRKMVFAELVSLDSGVEFEPGVHLVNSVAAFPGKEDGGCHVVSLVYDVGEARVIGMRCNEQT